MWLNSPKGQTMPRPAIANFTRTDWWRLGLRLELVPLRPGKGFGKDGRVRFVDTVGSVADDAWGALDLAEIDGVTVRLHWTDQPYHWHVNDSSEVFVVLGGAVDMHYLEEGKERVERLTPGRVCVAEEGDQHFAHPVPAARILVVERKGSV